MSHKDERLFTALAAAAEWGARDLTSQGLANTTWAFAKVSHKGERLFTALVAAAKRRMGHFNLQNVASTAWALSVVVVGQLHSQLFLVMA